MQNPPLYKRNRLSQLLLDQAFNVKADSIPIHSNVTSQNQQTKKKITSITPTALSLNHHDHTANALLNEKI